jgi:hypothetical protein
MKVECPICHELGYVQQRYRSVRVGHYKGYKGKTRIIEWHCTTANDVLMVNKDMVKLDESGRLEEKDHVLPHSPQTHNLENNNRGTKAPNVQKSRARIPPRAPTARALAPRC